MIQDRPLSTDLVFPALTLFNLLTFPLTMLPLIITSIIEASVAVGRLTEYLNAEELQTNAVMRRGPAEKTGEEAIRISQAAFTWNRYENRQTLDNIDFTARKGELACIVGRVGSGKSSLLEAMLGNLYKVKGEVMIRGAVAYVAQSPWVMNASVKENVLFGHRWDPSFYDKTIKACALLEDFSSLPDGDKTEVGERGISLSGGQKARLTLARAVYARADVYLLDDILSAVDGHVGRHIIDNVLGSGGLLSTKTRVLATNSIPVLTESHHITLVQDGLITETGTYAELLKKGGGVAEFIKTANNDDSGNEPLRKPEGTEFDSPGSDKTSVEEALDDDFQADEIEETQEGLTEMPPIKALPIGVERKDSMATLRRASTVSFSSPRGNATDEEQAGPKTKQSEENSEQGKVKWSVYGEYAKTSNLIAVLIYLATLIGAQTAQIGKSLPSQLLGIISASSSA